MKRIVLSLVLALTVVVVIALGAIFTGIYNVAASTQEIAPTRWLMRTTMEHSVSARAKNILVPSLADSALISIGFEHYNEMCVTCHGSPAGGRSEAGQGLNPPASDLGTSAKDWTPSELYWIISNGIKMSGMPAFGPTHEPKEVWAMVAFLKTMTDMDSTQYNAMKTASPEHDEGPGEPEHHHHGDN